MKPFKITANQFYVSGITLCYLGVACKSNGFRNITHAASAILYMISMYKVGDRVNMLMSVQKICSLPSKSFVGGVCPTDVNMQVYTWQKGILHMESFPNLTSAEINDNEYLTSVHSMGRD